MRGMRGFRPGHDGRPIYRPRRVYRRPMWGRWSVRYGWGLGLGSMGCLLPVLGIAAVFVLAFLRLIF